MTPAEFVCEFPLLIAKGMCPEQEIKG